MPRSRIPKTQLDADLVNISSSYYDPNWITSISSSKIIGDVGSRVRARESKTGWDGLTETKVYISHSLVDSTYLMVFNNGVLMFEGVDNDFVFIPPTEVNFTFFPLNTDITTIIYDY